MIFKKNNIYKKYADDNISGYFNLIINESKDIFQILESSFDGTIRIWNFHKNFQEAEKYIISILNLLNYPTEKELPPYVINFIIFFFLRKILLYFLFFLLLIFLFHQSILVHFQLFPLLIFLFHQ